MLLFHGATQTSGHKKIVSYFAAPARDATVSFNKTNNADRNRYGAGCAARFSADYADFEPFCGPGQSAIKPLRPFDLHSLGSNESDQCKLRDGRRCGEIA